MQREILAIPAREQQRIGEELHDGLGQQLTGLSMLAQSLLNKASKPEHELAEQLATGLHEALTQVRALSRGLMPIQVYADGFMISLQEITDSIAQQSNIPIKLQIDDVVLLFDDATAAHLYRIVQESLNNAVKHADASEIKVSLKTEQDHGLLEIVDNGVGIPSNLPGSAGLGLHIMKHRCGLFDGEITINPAGKCGTQVRCRFPLIREKHLMANIFIVDDHPLVRAGFAQLIGDTPDLKVCGEAGDMATALKLLETITPDLAIIDLSLAGGSGLDLIEHIKARDSEMLMLVASMHDESLYAERVLAAGARGYINKQEAQEKIIKAIRIVLKGKVYLSEQMTERILNNMVSGTDDKRDIDALSNRELQVFEMIGQGATPATMAEQLNLSIKTIETHQTHIKRKLGLNTAHMLAHRAIRWVLEQEQ